VKATGGRQDTLCPPPTAVIGCVCARHYSIAYISTAIVAAEPSATQALHVPATTRLNTCAADPNLCPSLTDHLPACVASSCNVHANHLRQGHVHSCPPLSLAAGGGSSTSATLTTPNSCNSPPTAAVKPSTTATQLCNTALTLDGSASSDPDAANGDTLTYDWAVQDKTGNPVPVTVDAATPSVLTIPYGTLTAGVAYTVSPEQPPSVCLCCCVRSQQLQQQQQVRCSQSFAVCIKLCVCVQASLTVTDSEGESSTAGPVSITVKSCGQPPVAKLSGSALTLKCGGSTTLDGEQCLVQHFKASRLVAPFLRAGGLEPLCGRLCDRLTDSPLPALPLLLLPAPCPPLLLLRTAACRHFLL
jgi:hypothetical protein